MKHFLVITELESKAPRDYVFREDKVLLLVGPDAKLAAFTK